MKYVVILSGGMDSSVLLEVLQRDGSELKALTFNYGQRHKKEIKYARRFCKAKGVPHSVVNLSVLRSLLPGSSQTDSSVPVPEGHYSEENMKATVVPNRNMIMLSVAIGHAIALGYDAVAYAAHAGDHAIYPDCRLGFVQAMRDIATKCDWKPIAVVTPFIDWTKAQIVGKGADMGFRFSRTWSCYQGGRFHCGKCGTCIERREAFWLAGVKDPTRYASDAPTTAWLVEHNWKLS